MRPHRSMNLEFGMADLFESVKSRNEAEMGLSRNATMAEFRVKTGTAHENGRPDRSDRPYFGSWKDQARRVRRPTTPAAASANNAKPAGAGTGVPPVEPPPVLPPPVEPPTVPRPIAEPVSLID